MSDWNVGFLEGIFNPERLRVEEYRKKQETLNPFQQIMAKEYLKQKPEASFMGTVLEPIQKQYEQELLERGGPLWDVKKDKSGKTIGYKPKEGAKEKLEREKIINPIVMTERGFETLGPKDRTAQNILSQVGKGRQYETIEDLPIGQKLFIKKWAGVKSGKTGPVGGKDMDDFLKTAQDRATFERINKMAEQMRLDGAQDFEIQEMAEAEKERGSTFAEAQPYFRETMAFQWPDVSPERAEELLSKYDVDLPEGINKLDQVITFLRKHGIIHSKDPNPKQSAVDWMENNGYGLKAE